MFVYVHVCVRTCVSILFKKFQSSQSHESWLCLLENDSPLMKILKMTKAGRLLLSDLKTYYKAV